MSDKPINLEHRRLVRSFKQSEAEYARLQPQLEALRSTSPIPYCYIMELISEIANYHAVAEVPLELVIYQLSMNTDNKDMITILDNVRKQIVYDQEGRELITMIEQTYGWHLLSFLAEQERAK